MSGQFQQASRITLHTNRMIRRWCHAMAAGPSIEPGSAHGLIFDQVNRTVRPLRDATPAIDSEVAFYANLQPNSIRVEDEDKVRKGQVIELLGIQAMPSDHI